MKTKALSRVEIKDETKGTIQAVFASRLVDSIDSATGDDIDSDGDITLKGTFTEGAPVVISAYGHKSWEGELPVGKGTIREQDGEAVLDGQFLINTTHGRDAFETVKALSEDGLQEWSYSLEDVEAERATVDGKRVRVLKRIAVKEVSPVLRGAGIDTRTLAAKSRKQLHSQVARNLADAGRERWGADGVWVYPADFDTEAGYAVFNIYADDEADRLVRVEFTATDDSVELSEEETDVEQVTSYAPKGARFSEHAESVLADVDALIERATDVVALRAEKGKSISEDSAGLLTRLDASLQALKALIGEPTPNDHVDDATAEWLRFVASAQGAPLS
jgi:hypothetical protein